MTGEPAALPDAGPCGWCGDAQWDHKRGRAGCKVLGCPCGKYEPPATGPVPAAAKPEPTCAYPNGEDEGEHDHALCQDVVAERAELAGVVEADPASPVPGVAGERPDDADPGEPAPEPDDEPPASGRPPMPPAGFLAAHTMVGERAAAGAGWQEGYLAGQAATAAGPDPALAQAVAVAEALAAERDAARRECDRLASRLDIIRKERRREHLAHQVAILTAELEQVRRERDAAVVQRDDMVEAAGQMRAELDTVQGALQNTALAYLDTVKAAAAARRVLLQYDARQCETCGSRYTADVDHEHPLTDVTVLVVAREVPGA